MENQATFVRFTPEGALEASRAVQGHPLAAAMLRDYARLLLEDEARRSPVPPVPPGWAVPRYGDGGVQAQHPQPTQASAKGDSVSP